jgi:hypothetical protein
MANRTSIYKFLYSQFGDIWYPGYDYENMLTAETNFSGIYSFFGTGVIDGWDVSKLTDTRADQILLLDGYNSSHTSEYGQKLSLLDLDFTVSCRAATTANITLSNTQTIDGIVLAAGDLVLVKNQSTASQNGVYTVASGSWTRHSSLDASSDYSNNFVVYVSLGTANQKTLWLGAVSATNFNLATSNLYFQDAFKQCIKVGPGNGIIDKYAAKTEKPHYFRQTVNNTFYAWAESGISTLSDEICNITCPSLPDSKYNTYSNAVYLATVIYEADPTYTNINIVSEIVYEERRNQINESVGEFKRQLELSYLKHKHLGEINTPNKIDLGNFLVLTASTNDGSLSYDNSSIFILKNSDGTLFNDTLSSYGTPIVKLDGITLSNTEYTIGSSSPFKIYLSQGIKSTSKLEIYLPYAIDKNLIAINDSQALITSSLAFNSNIRLSDGTIYQYTDSSGITTDKYAFFAWTDFQYDTAEVYLAETLVDPIHYTINPYSGCISLKSSTPNYDQYTFLDLKIVVKVRKTEITNSLSDDFVRNLSAYSISTGKISINNLKINHYNENRYKEALTFTPDKFLTTGIGKTYLYPQNVNSAIQYNDNISAFYKSANIFTSLNLIYAASSRGLFTYNLGSNTAQSSNWQNDYGKILSLQDNVIYPTNENYFKNIYAFTSLGKVYYNNASNIWNELKLPTDSSGIAKTLSAFKVSSDKLANGTYQTFQYGLTTDKIYYSIIPDNTAYQNWMWSEISTFYDSSGSGITNIYNLSGIEEVSTERNTYVQNSPDNITVDRALYVGAIGTSTKGLYYGDFSQLSQIFNETVKGVYWIKDGAYKNNIIWWNDYQAFITHTAKYFEDTTGKYWSLPFSQSTSSFTNARCATTANISLIGTQTIDGVSVSVGNVVLVKNQTTKSQNGIYIVSSGSWTRSTELDASSEFINWKTIYVSDGTISGDSTWYLYVGSSFSLGTSDVVWDVQRLKIYQNSTPSGAGSSSIINCVIQRNSTAFPTDYLVGHSNGVARIQESAIGTSAAYSELFWEPVYQGSVNSLYSFDDGSNFGKLYAGTNNGIFLSTELLWQDVNVSSTLSLTYRWKRPNDTFNENETEFAVFDSNYNQITNFTLNYPYQMVAMGSSYIPGNQLYYEKSFNTFTTDPWNNTGSDKTRLFTYINNQPSTIPFYSNSSEGKITFTQSVLKKDIDNVKVSIVNDFPTLSDAGTKPHSSTFVPLYKTKNPIALLSSDSLSTDTKIYVNQRISDYSLLELKSGNNYEIVVVKSIDNTSFPTEITLSSARSTGTATFAAGTEVYGIKNEIVSGLEDDLYLAISNQTYNLASENNSNLQELARKIKSNNSSIFDFVAPTITQTDTRGLKNTLLVDNFSSNSNFDSLNSSYKNRTELIPTVNDFESDPIQIKGIIGLSKDGIGSRVITEKGVWKYTGYWELESTLDGAVDASSIAYNPNLEVIVGASNGLWKYDGSWNKLTSAARQYSYLSGFWNGSVFEAYGTSDGLSVKLGTTNFQSDFLKLTTNNINGLFKGIYIKNSAGTVSEYESLHAAGDDGYYVMSNETQYATFSSFLVPRKMFSAGNPQGVSKFYKSFQAYSIPSTTTKTTYANPLFILTNDGVLKVRNWKYCYPDDLNSSDFFVESRYLRGLHCFSYAIDTEAASGNVPGKSKIYIGTNDGVYRSFDEGNTFERSDYIGTLPTCVYDLQIFSSTFNSITQNVLVACTNNGIWYSLDDGDCWYRTGENTSEGYSPVLFASKPSNDIRFINNDSSSVGYLAQTFTTSSTASTISKVSAFLSIREQDNIANSSYNDSLLNTTLTAYVYSVDTNSAPQTQLAASSPITSSNVKIGAFTSFNLTSNLDIPGTGSTTLALVIKETASSIPIFKWKKASTSNPFSGYGYTSSNAVNWSGISTSYDFFFQAHYDNANAPTETIVPIGNYNNTEVNWDSGQGKGVISSDTGYLYLNPKFVISNVFDNSASMKMSSGFSNNFNNLITNIFARTNKSSYTQFSFADLWTFGTSIKHETGSGFTNSGTAITSIVSTLNFDGDNSNLYDCLEYALIGQQPAAISGIADTTLISTYKDYLSDQSLIRLDLLKTRYKNESNKQLNLVPKMGSSTGSTLTFSTDGTNTFTWNTTDYPYSEVVKNGSVLGSGYTVIPSTGKVSFVSSIGTTDSVVVYLRKDWDGTSATIPSNSTVSKYMMDRVANSYIPLVFAVSDADNNTTVSLKSVENSINYSWGNKATKFIAFGIDDKTNTGILRQLVQNTNGLYLDASSDLYWAGITSSLLHGGSNTLFAGYWTKSVEFDTPKFIKSITTAYIVSSGQSVDSTCIVKYKYSTDKKNFTDWIILTSTSTLNKEITNLNFQIDMTEGWNNSTSLPVVPYVSQLYYTEVSPAVNYLYTNALNSTDDIFEYILSSDYSDTDKTKLTWGICKGNSTNWNDYEELIRNKNGIISSRQRSYKYTNAAFYDKLTCIKSSSNNLTYFAFYENERFTWLLSDAVEVYLNSSLINPNNYTIDNVNGTIIFKQEVSSGNNVQVSISREGTRYEAYGEGTVSTDYKHYYAINGRWPEDSKAIVLVNNNIVRAGYKLDRYNGKIIFDTDKSASDIITFFVLQSSSYRLGLKVETFSSTASSTYNFEFTHNGKANSNVYSHYLNTNIPSLKAESLVLNADVSYTSIGSTVQIASSSRTYVDYKYISDNQQFRPRTRWYRTRTSGGGTTTVELDSTPNYRDRLVQRKADLNAANDYFKVNDLVYVTLEPNDNFDYGIMYTSQPIIVKSLSAPYVYDVQIKSASIITDNKISANSFLQAYYNFNGTTDLSSIEWYEWTNGVSNRIAQGTLLNPAVVLKNMAISFIVKPYDGTTYGIPIESQVLNVV